MHKGRIRISKSQLQFNAISQLFAWIKFQTHLTKFESTIFYQIRYLSFEMQSNSGDNEYKAQQHEM